MKPRNSGYTLIEVMFTSALIGVLGLIIYSILTAGTILSAKNAAVNTAHQQARIAMLQMVQDLHSAISLPQLVDTNGNQVTGAGPAAGISFQLFTAGPFRVWGDATTSQNQVNVAMPAGATAPVNTQRLIIPSHQIEDNITAVSNQGSFNIFGTNYTLYTITLANNLRNAITGTGGPTFKNFVCYLSDRCSYVVQNQQLTWNGPTTRKAFSVMGHNIISPTPFTMPTTPAGAIYYRSVAAIDLSTSDLRYSNRGFKSANILLNGQVPMRARLTTYQ